MPPSVVSVSLSPTHSFSKAPASLIRLIENHGVEGDAHAGATTQHRYLKKKNPFHPNLTQVHLLQSELFPSLARRGFQVQPGELGENITTKGIDLLTLPLGALLRFGTAVVEVTGLRSPCTLINGYQKGLMKELVGKGDDGRVIRRSGIMGIIVRGGDVAPGQSIDVELPVGKHLPLGIV